MSPLLLCRVCTNIQKLPLHPNGCEEDWLRAVSVLLITWSISPTMSWKNMDSPCMPTTWIPLPADESSYAVQGGDEFQTLDGRGKKWTAVLMICDAEKEVGIAGIMGGEIPKSQMTWKQSCLKLPASAAQHPQICREAYRPSYRCFRQIWKAWIPIIRWMPLTGCMPADSGTGLRWSGWRNRGCMRLWRKRVRIPFWTRNVSMHCWVHRFPSECWIISDVWNLNMTKQEELIIPSFPSGYQRLRRCGGGSGRFYGYDKITALPNGKQPQESFPSSSG